MTGSRFLCVVICVFGLISLYESYNFKKVEWRFGPLITLDNLSTEKPKSVHTSTETSVPLRKEEVCRQPSESGLCYASISRVYYNFDNKTCENFYWGGCNKNENNFATKEECEAFCKDVL